MPEFSHIILLCLIIKLASLAFYGLFSVETEKWKIGFFVKYKGAFNNYVDRWEWVGGQLIVYAHKVKDLFLFTWFVYEGWVVQ